MLGTDYPFPLGEVKIVDTWPGKTIQACHISNAIKVSEPIKQLDVGVCVYLDFMRWRWYPHLI